MIPTAFINHACGIIAETNTGISGPKIVEYLSAYAVDFDIDIPFANYPFPNTVPNKRTALKKNLSVFSPEQQVQIINDLCLLPDLKKNEAVRDLRYQLTSRYGHLLGQLEAKDIDKELIEQTKHWLKEYPKSLKLYKEALRKYENKIFHRNLLDDLRLSLEKFLQELLENKKAIEKQQQSLGDFIKKRNCSKELNNMFLKLVDYYATYQNTYIKHDDAVVESEIEIIFEMTCSFMRFLTRI
jgi:hypothetical protein